LFELLKGADTDASGSIDYTEFLAATMDAQIYMRDDYLRNAFDMFDKDKSGKIDKNEITSLLQGEDMANLVPTAELL
jgi:calcium-dependent protein kinase